ncbi:MAG TPA: glycosyltransferase 87 family protein [Actinophytocola sp.]|jgi:alpha-1,2-mannosyltransferase|nr:glycosyltransferase 87 family protein [Actinophytocola sp.]
MSAPPAERELSTSDDQRQRTWLLVLGAAVAAAGLAILFTTYRHGWAFWMMDFHVYRQGAETLVHGGDLYDVPTGQNLFFSYTPISAMLLIPLVLVPFSAATVVWTASELFFLQLAAWLALGAAGVRRTGPRAVLTVGIAFAAMFVISSVDNDLALGQINILLMFLVLADLLRGEGKRWQGVWIGLAAAIKLIPLIYVVYLLVTGRTKAALRAIAVFVVAFGIGFALLPSDAAFYWTGKGMSLDRVGAPDNLFNQSLRGALGRLLDSGATIGVPWLLAALVVGVAGLAAAAVLYRRGERLRSVLVMALTTLLVSPVSWEHHWVWTVPLLILLGGLAWQRRSVWWGLVFAATTATYGLRLLDMAMPPPTSGGLDEVREQTANALSAQSAFVDHVLPNGLVIGGLVLLAILAFPALRRPPTDGPDAERGRADVAGAV